MGVIFDVQQIAERESITVKLRNGGQLRAKDLLPEVVDGLGLVVDGHAKQEAQEEIARRRLIATLQDEKVADEAYGAASVELTELTTKAAARGRVVAYEQMAVVFAHDDGTPVTVAELQAEIPLPVANQIADALTRQILGRKDAEEGNAPGSEQGPTPTASTS